ncbi:hypothetical protein [Agromyces sp. Leaf222]|uniref:hypothetical protein n=1 Tax=Agromyces sp. Leaf222 TaxID=1735688 RepID=UPI0006FF193C|nr:hypothetical protein [Agromyces sp. Leaf222]KQM81279.1 hypothetical protein ASE68_15945 [Agromyces sp. Leaf222]
MTNEIQLINDGDGVALIGDPGVIDKFLSAEGLASKELGLPRLGAALSSGSGVLQAGSEIAAHSGQWVKLTEKSAQALKAQTLMRGSNPSVSRAVLTKNGKITGLLEIVKTPGAMLTNPAILAGAGGIMAQLAMQQAMDEITEYLAKIDEKLDDVLRAQKDAVLADMIGVGFMIDEAMTVRAQVGRVSDVTWSKVQGTSMTIARTQAYALRALDAFAEKLERKSKVGDLAEVAKGAESQVQEWLGVLARCFQLQDAIAVLELDRMLSAAPQELDEHRIGLQTARRNRRDLIARSTARLIERMNAAAGMANTKVLLHPIASGEVVRSSNLVTNSIGEFHGLLGIEAGGASLDAKRWREAAVDAKDKAIETGTQGVDATVRFGNETLVLAKSVSGKVSTVGVDGLDATMRFGNESVDRAKSMASKMTGGFAERGLRRRGREDARAEPTDGAND